MWLKFQLDCWPLLTDYTPGGERGVVLVFIQSHIISQYLSHMFWNIKPLFLIKMSNKLANYKIVYNLNFIKNFWIKKYKGDLLEFKKNIPMY